MDKKIAGLIGAVSTLIIVDGASASTPAIQPPAEPQSYADLLQPIPNAVALLAARKAPSERGIQVADETIIKKEHHHHHHHHHHDHDHD